jgi:ArsR family transcriptional regulator, lead/cadmium/zinc/bismuth-responsive transcriptional repressor
MGEYVERIAIDNARVCEGRQYLLNEVLADDLAGTFKALADPTRLRMLSVLSGIELCVGELAAVLEMSVSAVSHQLRSLRLLRVVKSRREGRHIYYSLDDDHIAGIYQQALAHVLHGEGGVAQSECGMTRGVHDDTDD